jgi:hypothetical protein
VGNGKHHQNPLREMEFPPEEGWKVEVQVIENQLQSHQENAINHL